MTMTMALLIVDDDDVEENDHHAGSTNAPQVPHIRPKQYNTIQHKVTIQYKYKVTAVDATQQGPGRAQT